ncbi:MAG: WYL domain-containing protein [Intrasporangium sp.]|uniref:helix-turn-helix transcriptional regulator n=1 Tax=Intrasporangium sp. TaxID=1925024 RepID=UPI002647E48C|nr:WYL domain-containing protein [Intrasporangium sp.]MDN5798229.1 WYL domain-containing protein [Intrasporangium sp.]
MPSPATRLLELLSLLQLPRDWTGAQLAERLDVSARTVRSDIERLRQLGYAVHATRGGIGGYRLGASGSAIPPLLLDAEEAVAVAVGLRTGVNCIIGGMEETSALALAKLERVLPDRLRGRVRHLNRYTVPLPATQPVPVVDPARLTQLVELCHARERLRFTYEDLDAGEQGGGESRHEVEPYRLVNRGHHWYLLGYEITEQAWRVFRVDRMQPRTPTGPRFRPRELPAADLADYVSRRVPDTAWRHRARVTIHAPAAAVRDQVVGAEGSVEPVDEHACVAVLGGESLTAIALVLGRLTSDFTIIEPAELVAEVQAIADRYHRAVQPVVESRNDPDVARLWRQ